MNGYTIFLRCGQTRKKTEYIKEKVHPPEYVVQTKHYYITKKGQVLSNSYGLLILIVQSGRISRKKIFGT